MFNLQIDIILIENLLNIDMMLLILDLVISLPINLDIYTARASEMSSVDPEMHNFSWI